MKFLKKYNDDKKFKDSYLEDRLSFFDIKSSDFNKRITGKALAAIIDVQQEDFMMTLICIADGTADIYCSNGNKNIGLSKDFKNLKTASKALLSTARKIKRSATLIENDNYNVDFNDHCIYIVEDEGVYKRDLVFSYDNENNNDNKLICLKYTQVLTEIQEVLKDKKRFML